MIKLHKVNSLQWWKWLFKVYIYIYMVHIRCKAKIWMPLLPVLLCGAVIVMIRLSSSELLLFSSWTCLPWDSHSLSRSWAQITEEFITQTQNTVRCLFLYNTPTLSWWTLLCRPSVLRLGSLAGNCSWAIWSHLRREPESRRNCSSCCSQLWIAFSL